MKSLKLAQVPPLKEPVQLLNIQAIDPPLALQLLVML